MIVLENIIDGGVTTSEDKKPFGKRLPELLFELSNPDRLRLLSIVETSPLKLTQMSSTTQSTVQETSRHLDRLVKAELLCKNATGEFYVTTFGKMCLEELSTLEFLSDNKEYFLEHDLSFLPKKFLHRLGELSASIRVKSVTDVLHHTENVVARATKYIFLMADQMLLPTGSFDQLAKASEGFRMKLIIPPFVGPPPAESLPNNAELRFIENPKVAIAMNESLAGVAFPDLKGRMDMSCGFTGSDLAIHEWCYDYFTYSWNESNKSPSIEFSF